MKNTLFFDEDFLPVLLKNEEADAVGMRNAIFLHFKTTASANQKLQITVRGQLNEITLDSSTEYDLQLTGEYWASGGTTSLRLVNMNFTSGLTYINFPEIISIDAALQEQDAENNEYYLQGKQDQIDELKTTLLVYKNGGEYNITNLSKIVELFFLSRNDDIGAMLTLTLTVICSGITTTSELEFHYRVNSAFDEVFVPTETVENGKYIVTLTYPVEGISSSLNNHAEIYMKLGEGNAQILQGGAIATLMATGIMNGAPDPWDGNLDIVERIQAFAISGAGITVTRISEEFSAEVQEPQAETMTEVISPIELQNLFLSIAEVYDSAIVGRRTLALTIEPTRATEYSFFATYVNVTNTAFSLRSDYDFVGVAGSIDSGYMTSVSIPLDDFTAVTSLTVTEVTA